MAEQVPRPKDTVEIARLLQQLTSDLSQVLDTDWALTSILRHGCTFLDAFGGVAIATDSRGEPAHRLAHSAPARPSDQFLVAFEQPMKAGLFDLSGPPVVIEEMDESRPGFSSLLDAGVRACLVQPLVHRGERRGAIAFFFDQPRHLTPEEIVWSSVVTGYAAFALENSRLFETALRQATELGVFHETAGALADQRDLSILLRLIIERAMALLGCHAGAIYLANDDERKVRVVAQVGVAEAALESELDYGCGCAGQVAASHDTVIVGGPAPGGTSDGTPPRRMTQTLGVPMVWRQGLIGVLVLISDGATRGFYETELRLAKLVAYQAANALGIANLVELERGQRRMAEALEGASRSISSEIDLDEVLDRILEQVMHAFPCEAANLQAREGDLIRVIRARGYERYGVSAREMLSTSFRAGQVETTKHLVDGHVFVISDTAKSPDWQTFPRLEWIRSWAGVPVRFGDETLGFINLDSSEPGAFDHIAIGHLMAFGAHAAIALHNARLFQRLSDQHHRLLQVYEAGHRLSGSLAPEEIITSLLQAALEASGGTWAALFPDKGESGAHTAPAQWASAPGLQGTAPDPAEAEPVLRKALTEERPQIVAQGPSAGHAALAAFPVAAGASRFGAVVIWIREEIRDPSGWLDMLAAIGQEAGLALANSDQYRQVQRRLAEMTLLQRVVGSIALQLEVDAVLSEVTEQLHTQLGFPAVHLFRRTGEELALTKFAGPRPLIDRTSLERGIVGRVARTGSPALVEDVRRDPDYVASLVGTRAALAVPIRQGHEVIGVISIETSDPEQITQGALELMTLLADQVSIALQNAALYEQVTRDVETLEARVRERTALLEKAVEQAQTAERAKTQFVADVSHELRTPLTNIGLYLDLLELGTHERWGDYMATLRRETARLAGLIEQLLAISQLDTGQIQLKVQPVDVNALMRVLIGDRERLITAKGLTLDLRAEPALPMAKGDPRYIMQVLANLLTNAMNYTPTGGKITLTTQRRQWRQRPWVTLSVADTGPGIPPEEQRKIFDRFYRGLAGRASGVAGTGLGLPICKEIIDRHGGRIELHSRVGQGALFTVWLPAADGAPVSPLS